MPCRFKTPLLSAMVLLFLGITPGNASVTRFVSFSMPETSLKEAMRAAGKSMDETVVFRGLPESGGYPAFIRQLIPLIRDLPKSERPRIRIDPKAFDQEAIAKVPVVQEGSYQDLRHARYPVTEPDPRTRMREAISKVTPAMWKAALLKDDAQINPRRLPRSTAESRFTLEPVYRIPRTLKGASGNVLAAEGQSANPLDVLPGPFSFLMLDPDDARQVQAVRERQQDLKGSILLLAGLRPGQSDSTLLTWLKASEVPIYPIPDRWLEQLRIMRLPAEVRAKGSVLEVREWPS